MTRMTWAICLVLPALSTTTLLGADKGQLSKDTILLKRCDISYDRATVLRVFASHGTAVGRLDEVLVKQGDRVKAGQVLGRLFQQDVVAERDTFIASLGGKQIAVAQKDALYTLEVAKLERLKKINARQALLVSAQDMQVQQITMQVAKLDIQAAIQDRKLAEASVRQLEAVVNSRNLISPHDGVVVDIYVPVGESYMNSKELFRVVDVDHLRVTGYLDARDRWRVKAGQPVRIMPEISGGELSPDHDFFTGEVTFVDSEIDKENQTCRVIALVKNRDSLLCAGLFCRMEIDAPIRVQEKPAPAKAARGPVRPDALFSTSRPGDQPLGR